MPPRPSPEAPDSRLIFPSHRTWLRKSPKKEQEMVTISKKTDDLYMFLQIGRPLNPANHRPYGDLFRTVTGIEG